MMSRMWLQELKIWIVAALPAVFCCLYQTALTRCESYHGDIARYCALIDESIAPKKLASNILAKQSQGIRGVDVLTLYCFIHPTSD
jgi:hypothetical protein